MTTTEAFTVLISKRNWYKGLKIGASAANTVASRFRADQSSISINKMEDLLTQAGAKVIQEKLWKIE